MGEKSSELEGRLVAGGLSSVELKGFRWERRDLFPRLEDHGAGIFLFVREFLLDLRRRLVGNFQRGWEGVLQQAKESVGDYFFLFEFSHASVRQSLHRKGG